MAYQDSIEKKRRFAFPKRKSPNNEPTIEQVSPMVAIEDRAESDLKQQKNDNDPYIEKKKNAGIKRKASKNKRISKRKSKGKGAKKISKKVSKGKKKKNTRIRKIALGTVPSIFDKIKRKK